MSNYLYKGANQRSKTELSSAIFDKTVPCKSLLLVEYDSYSRVIKQKFILLRALGATTQHA